MTRERAADAFGEIAERVRELRSDHDKVLTGECGCPTSYAAGVPYKVHAENCPLRSAE